MKQTGKHQRALVSATVAVMTALATVLMVDRALAQPAVPTTDRPLRIVLTNDDGIGELESRVFPLARVLSAFAEIHVVVPSTDRSGTGSLISVGSRKRAIESELVYTGIPEGGTQRVDVHVVDGYPADCVALALGGILKDDPPDLLISGPNGGPNLGADWLGSGTVGAARIAAYFGVPAIAVSGLDDDDPEAVQALSAWIAQLARSELVETLEPGQYLTVAVPRTSPSNIEGVRIAPRARPIGLRYFDRAPALRGEGREGPRQVWLLQIEAAGSPPPLGSDVDLYLKDYIVVTPMRADEHDYEAIEALRARLDDFPEWPAAQR
jgi:5'-nucleotidase